jgi:YHS domain-containing protein
MKHYLTFFALCLSLLAAAQTENAHRRRNFNHDNDVAMREFDPVSYFQNKPVKGTSQFQYNHKGIIYFFANAANLEEFKKAPGKYEPAYGGWCAYTVAQSGERVKINPVSYKIIDGRLFLFYNFSGDNRLRKWSEGDEKKLKAAADKKWVEKMH